MKGVMFIEQLYLKTVNGYKTMTRRSGGLTEVNEQPDEWTIVAGGMGLCTEKDAIKSLMMFIDMPKKESPYRPLVEIEFGNTTTRKFITCRPRYKYNEIIFVKEPTFYNKDGDKVYYKYDYYESQPLRNLVYCNKMFMPTDHARVFLRVIGIKMERLHAISDNDCVSEGILPVRFRNNERKAQPMKGKGFISLKEAFFELYKFANKKKTGPNDWVWVYSFEYLPNYKNEKNKAV